MQFISLFVAIDISLIVPKTQFCQYFFSECIDYSIFDISESPYSEHTYFCHDSMQNHLS